MVVATVMCMGGAFAQLSMGPKLGLNVSSLTGDGSNFRAGMNVGIFANYRINKLLAIQPEFYYSMQGAGFDDIPVLTKTLESNYTSHYLNIPVLLKIYPWAGLNVHFGPQFGPDVTVVIPGMAEVRELEQNLAACSNTEPLADEELKAMDKVREQLGTDFCRRCSCSRPAAREEPHRYHRDHRMGRADR